MRSSILVFVQSIQKRGGKKCLKRNTPIRILRRIFMIIEGNKKEIEAMEQFHKGNRQEGLRLQEEFAAAFREEYKDKVIDHINGNPRDNRKANLRVCSQGENVRNKSFMSNNTSGFIGISYREDRDRYDPEIRLQGQRCHLGYTKTKEEAVYKRYYAEKLVFKEFANSTEQQKKEEFTKNLSAEQKYTLEKIVEEKLQAKGLWQ